MRRKIVFSPGSFDSFEGTQEELNDLVEKITESLQKSQFEESISAWNLDELAEIDPDVAEAILSNPTKRTLH